jgi:hypothetical protein
MPTHLRANGYKVTVVQPDNMSLIKKKFRVPQEYEGCHTTIIDGYVIEGSPVSAACGNPAMNRAPRDHL